MTIPNRDELIFYTNTPLDDADYENNWLQVIDWLTSGDYDITVNDLSIQNDLTVAGDVTVSGNVTANAYYGDGSNLTGINVSGSGVAGLQTLEIQSNLEKTKLSKVATYSRTNIVESFVTTDNFTAALQTSYTANQTLISLTLNSSSYAPLYTELIAENTSTGDYYTFQCTSLGSDAYPTVTYTCTPINANLTAGSCNIYRSTLSKSLPLSAAIITASKTGDSAQLQTACTPQVNLATALVASSVDWETTVELPQYELSRTAGDLTTTTFKIIVNSDMSTEFITNDSSGTQATGVLEDRNKVIVTKSINSGNGSVNYEPLSNGGIFTLTSVAYSTGYLTLTVSENTATVIDSDDITNKNITYLCSPLYAVPKVSVVADESTAEDFVEVTPSVLINKGNGICFPTYIHSYWKMDSLSGNEPNWKTQPSYDLTQNGTISTSSGKIGRSRGQFSAANYFSWNAGGSSATVYDTNLFIVEGWFKTSSTGVNQMIIQKKNFSGVTYGWAVYINSANKLYCELNFHTTLTSGSTYTDGNWHYFTIGQRANSGSNEFRMYIDGSLSVQASGGTFSPSSANLKVGVDWDNTIPFLGLIDSIAYWNSVPSTWAEIETIIAKRYNNGLGRPYGNGEGTILKGTTTAKSGARLSGKVDLLIPISTGYQNIQNIILSPQ